jgi:hypothetical protein
MMGAMSLAKVGAGCCGGVPAAPLRNMVAATTIVAGTIMWSAGLICFKFGILRLGLPVKLTAGVVTVPRCPAKGCCVAEWHVVYLGWPKLEVLAIYIAQLP